MAYIFTLEQGKSVQERNLIEWKTVLTSEAYNILVKYCEKHNETAQDGWDIKRGNDLTIFIGNYSHCLSKGSDKEYLKSKGIV